MRFLRRKFYLLLLIILAVPLILHRINGEFVTFPDELIIEEISYRMAQTNNFITPIFQNQVWLEKPPLYFWLTAPFYQVLPPLPFVKRIISAAGAFGLVIITFSLSRLILNPAFSFLSSLAVLTNYYFLALAKSGNYDLPLAFFLYLALIAYLKLTEKKSFKFLFGLAFGLAFMTRSLLALPFILVIALDLFWQGKKVSFFKNKKWEQKFTGVSTGIFISGVIILPWHLRVATLYPDKFFNQYLLFNSLTRFFPKLTPRIHLGAALVPPPLEVIFTFLIISPILLLTPLAILKSITQFKKIDPLGQILVIWSLIFPLPFLISKKIGPHYLVQVLPALIIIAFFYIKNILLAKINIHKTLVITTFFLINFSLGPMLFSLQKDPSTEPIKTQKLARQIAGPGVTIYSWKHNYFNQNMFLNLEPTRILNTSNLKPVLEKKEKIILLIPKKEISQIPQEFHKEKIVTYQYLALHWISFSK